MQRLDQERFPRRILEWCPPESRRKGRPQNSWMQEVRTGMRETGIGVGRQRRVEKDGEGKQIYCRHRKM